MAFVAVYDACVLYPAPLRDLLIRLDGNTIARRLAFHADKASPPRVKKRSVTPL